MAASVARENRSTHVNSVDVVMAKAAIDGGAPVEAGSDVIRKDAIALVFQALAEIGMAQKEAAITMEIDPATLSRIKHGHERLSFEAVCKLPTSWWTAFNRLRAEQESAITGRPSPSDRRARFDQVLELLNRLLEVA